MPGVDFSDLLDQLLLGLEILGIRQLGFQTSQLAQTSLSPSEFPILLPHGHRRTSIGFFVDFLLNVCKVVARNPCTIPEMHVFPPDEPDHPQTSLLRQGQPLYDVVLVYHERSYS